VIEHCVSAYNERCRQQVYQCYVADGLKSISEAVAGHLGGPYLQERYVDLIGEGERDERSADEIALEVIKKAGLKVRTSE
jgi:hypothetical protein